VRKLFKLFPEVEKLKGIEGTFYQGKGIIKVPYIYIYNIRIKYI
jgi:hypothetical protein